MIAPRPRAPSTISPHPSTRGGDDPVTRVALDDTPSGLPAAEQSRGGVVRHSTRLGDERRRQILASGTEGAEPARWLDDRDHHHLAIGRKWQTRHPATAAWASLDPSVPTSTRIVPSLALRHGELSHFRLPWGWRVDATAATSNGIALEDRRRS